MVPSPPSPPDPSDQLAHEPFESLVSLRDAMNRLFEESVITPQRFAPFGRVFPVDIRETDTDYVIEASLPGIAPEQLQITALDTTLTIRAARTRDEKAEQAEKYVRRERYVGEASRTIDLPGPIDPEKAVATYEHGVLTLRVPKAAAAKARQITVQTKEATAAH
jgi:HSP20 family protein